VATTEELGHLAPGRPAAVVRAGLPRPRRRRWKPSRAIRYAILIAGAIVFIAPFAYMITSSLQPEGRMFQNPPQWVPTDPTLENFKTFLGVSAVRAHENSQANVGTTTVLRWIFNSLFVASTVTICQLFFSSLAAYCYAKRRFPLRNFLFFLGLATMMVPGQVTIIPTYLIMKHMPLFGGNNIMGVGGHGWLDSYWVLIVPSIVSAFSVFLLRQYMRSIPDELIDAARVDGAGEFRIYWKLIVPLSWPALAAVAIFTFQFFWEDFYGPLIYITSTQLTTLPLGLAMFVVKNRTAWGVLMAGSVVATMPMILVFLIFQRRFVQGISVQGLKG
jgi:multiple sugar transport system permease protein